MYERKSLKRAVLAKYISNTTTNTTDPNKLLIFAVFHPRCALVSEHKTFMYVSILYSHYKLLPVVLGSVVLVVVLNKYPAIHRFFS